MASTAALSSPFLLQGAADLASSRSSVHGSSLPVASPKTSAPSFAPVSKLQCRAEKSEDSVPVPRRLALALLAGGFVAGSKISPASAAYGEAANVFGSPKQQSGFTVYKGDGFKLEVPSKWNPSKEREFPGTVLRYEDNFDAKSNLSVIIKPTDKPSIKDYGGPEKFLDEVKYLLGKQVYTGKTASEGGFDANAVSTAALLESKSKDVNGETYYDLDILTRTADGDEGGTHQRIVATVKGGKLYLLKAQAGDKRWFKGAQKFIKGVADSFAVA